MRFPTCLVTMLTLSQTALAFVTSPLSHHVSGAVQRQAMGAWTPARVSTVSTRAPTTTRTRLRMGIFEDISGQMKTCLKEGDKEKLNGLRMIRAAFLTETKTAGSGDTLQDEKCITILRKMSKIQQESIDMYRKGQKDDLVEKEEKMKELIDGFLPQLADEATTQKWIDEAVATSGAKGPSDMGKVMGLLMKAHKTEMDGKLAQKLVSAQLKGA